MHPKTHRRLIAAALTTAWAISACSRAPELLSSPSPASATAATTNVADVDVTEHVKTALQRNDALKAFDITVVTTNGDVRLAGMVDSQLQIDEAVRIARAAEGAHSIHDELTVKP